MNRRTTAWLAAFWALALAATACSEKSATGNTSPPATTATAGATTVAGSASASSAPTATEAPTSAPAGSTASSAPAASAAPTTAAGQDLNAWALKYTGGKAGPAGSGTVKVGYINQESFFPENTIGLEAAQQYINKELGGAAGESIEIVPCQVTVAEDGAKCGTQMANDPSIAVVLTGTVLVGNKEMYDALNGKKPVIIGNGLTADDFTTTAGQAFTTGSPGVVPGMAAFIQQYLPDVKSVAIVYQNNPGGTAAANLLFKPVLDKAGIGSTLVGIEDTATAADVQSALTAVGADKADALVPLVTIQQCISVYDALKALGINPTVVTSGLCFGTPMTNHLKDVGVGGDVPDGWYFGGYGYSYYLPDYDSGLNTYIAKVKQYGKPAPGASTLEYTGFAGPEFANLMTFAKFANELGPDKLDFASVDAKIRGFTGPMMGQVGPLNCGKAVILGLPFPAVCSTQMGIQQYKDGKWISVADALNNKPIDSATL